MIAMTIDRLSQMAVTAGPQVDLGLAHGVPGVVAFLGAACLAGHAATARPLLEDTVPCCSRSSSPPPRPG